MELLASILSSYFTSESILGALFEGIIFVIAVYGIFKAFLYFLRYYIIYKIAKKLAQLISLKDAPKDQPKPDREEEKLRDEEKEREAEKVEVEQVIKTKEQKQEQEFKIYLPKAIGKWQKMVLGSRQDMIIQVAQKMQATGNSNFWQTFVTVQKERETAYRGRR